MENMITVDGVKVNKMDYDLVNATLRDAGESAFFLRELEYTKRKSYDTKQRLLKAVQLIPVNMEADPGAETITYQTFTEIAIGKIVSDYADDAPRADVYGIETSAKVFTIGTKFGYSRQEIRRSRLAGRSLDSRRSRAAKRGSDEKLDRIAWLGDPTHNINGLINYPGITEYTVPADGTGSSKLWTTKTPDQIIRDIGGMFNAIVDTTNGIEVPDTLLLPVAQYIYLTTTRLTDVGTSIMKYVKENFPMLTTIDMLDKLKGAGTGGTDRMMMYKMSPDNLTLEIPLPYTQLPPQQIGYGFEVLTEQRTAGVIVYYPLSGAYGDGI